MREGNEKKQREKVKRKFRLSLRGLGEEKANIYTHTHTHTTKAHFRRAFHGMAWHGMAWHTKCPLPPSRRSGGAYRFGQNNCGQVVAVVPRVESHSTYGYALEVGRW